MAAKSIACQHDATPQCTDTSYSKCPHCSLDLCLEHIYEHQNLVRIEFNEVIDRINQQKSMSNDHSIVNELRTKALTELENWKTAKIEATIDIYNERRNYIERSCDECIDKTSHIQNTIFEELNMVSNAIEKKKHIHPRDMVPLQQKLNELNTAIGKIQKDIGNSFANFVAQIKLPEVIELEKRLEAHEKMIKDFQKKIDSKDQTITQKDNDIRRLRETAEEKDQKINNFQWKFQQRLH